MMMSSVAISQESMSAAMEHQARRDIRDMAREAKIQTQIITQQGEIALPFTISLVNVYHLFNLQYHQVHS